MEKYNEKVDRQILLNYTEKMTDSVLIHKSILLRLLAKKKISWEIETENDL